MKYSNLSDSELFQLLKQSDQLAFTTIYERYWPVLFVHANRMLGDEAEARDVIQDIFTILWTKADRIEIKTSLKSYLYTATRFKIFTLIGRSKLKAEHLNSLSEYIHQGAHTTEDWLNERELALSIDEGVAQLPTKMRSIFELSRKEYLSYQEISEKLNVTDHTVRKQISNALKLLKAKISLLF